MDVFDKHQLKIARHTLKMGDASALIMGGPTKKEAREIIKKITGKEVKDECLSA